MAKDKFDFRDWAPDYDSQVAKASPTDNWMFGGYDRILNTVVKYCKLAENSYFTVLDIGIGTGNLAARFLSNDMQVIGIDPSSEMLKICGNKFPSINMLLKGDFLHYPEDLEKVDVIVSTYAFHHVKPKDKIKAIQMMKDQLKPSGRIVIADFMYKNADAVESTHKLIKEKYKADMAKTFEGEYPALYYELAAEFSKAGFKVTGEQLSVSVWLICAAL
ncbi:MAG: class I SAM-dependent methyltransferase [Dehalococcoidales bacterium]|nr:class I SAM-dependent methyltransferase [Dehalococcoidales bacterium]